MIKYKKKSSISDEIFHKNVSKILKLTPTNKSLPKNFAQDTGKLDKKTSNYY